MECDRMDSEQDSKLSAWLDGELPASAASDVERHLSLCPACRALVDSLRQTSRTLARLQHDEVEADPGFLVRFRARRDELSVAPWWTWRQLALRLLPLAAVVLVAAIVSVLFSSGPDRYSRPARNLDALELEALGSPAGLDAGSAGEPVLSIALAPFPPEH